MTLKKFVVWSYCCDDPQVIVDVVVAHTTEQAEAKVREGRPYVDHVDGACALDNYIKNLSGLAGQTLEETQRAWDLVREI
jgi:hypothetical protein